MAVDLKECINIIERGEWFSHLSDVSISRRAFERGYLWLLYKPAIT